jgi:hypothetical protein
VTGSATWQRFETRSDTQFTTIDSQGIDLFRVFRTVGYRGRSVILNADVRYEVTKTLRVFANATRTDSRAASTSDDAGFQPTNPGNTTNALTRSRARESFDARWLAFAFGAEYDLRKDLTLGVTVSSWRLSDEAAPADGYSTHAVEVSLTCRF